MSTPDPANQSRRFNTRLGIVLFFIYTLLYVGFVLINAFAADMMESRVAAGLNLAIVYGFALIVIALLMALIYGVLCRRDSGDADSNNAAEGDGK